MRAEACGDCQARYRSYEPVPTLEQIREALGRHEPVRLPSPGSVHDRACVALIFAGPASDPSLCFIRRAKREGDPWSGHMALPGGRASPNDPTPRAVAERETHEEVGVSLAHADYLGALSDISLRRINPGDSVLGAFAYHYGPDLPALRPDPREVAAAFWIPAARLWDPTVQTEVEWEHGEGVMRFPGIAHGDDVIWGLTHRVLTMFGELLGRPLPHATPPPPV